MVSQVEDLESASGGSTRDGLAKMEFDTKTRAYREQKSSSLCIVLTWNPAQYSTRDPNSFAWPTARERWPIIVVSYTGFCSTESNQANMIRSKHQTGAIDDAYRSVAETEDAEKREEGKKIVEELAKLKYEIQHDRALTYGFLLVPFRICATEPGNTEVSFYI